MAEETPKILELEKEIKKKSIRFITSQKVNSNISLQDNYKLTDIPFTYGWAYGDSSYFSIQNNGIKVLKACEIKIHAAIDFSRTNGGTKSSDYCFNIVKNNVELAEAVVGVEDNGYHHHVDVYRDFCSGAVGDIIKLQAMTSVGGTLNIFGDANKVKTYLSVEVI